MVVTPFSPSSSPPIFSYPILHEPARVSDSLPSFAFTSDRSGGGGCKEGLV